MVGEFDWCISEVYNYMSKKHFVFAFSPEDNLFKIIVLQPFDLKDLDVMVCFPDNYPQEVWIC